jgi:hypothetical protein
MTIGAELAAVGVELIPGITGSDNVTIGTSTITGGTNGRVLFDNSGVIGEKPVTGSGSVVLATTPTLITPVLGAATGTSVIVTGALEAYSGTAIPAGGAATKGILVSSTANFGIFFGSGAPTLSAAKGSLYLRSDGSGINDRAYINTDSSTTWTAIVTVG